MPQAFLSQHVVLPTGTRPAALIVDDGLIQGICAPEEIPANCTTYDFDSHAIIPGLVDTHVHINEPGRTQWEGFRTATRAAAAGGFTTLVDMPLNCLPETTTVAALEAKRAAAQGQCLVDWTAWGGIVGDGVSTDNHDHILPLAAAGVPGYKCFLIYPGCDGFTAIDAEHLERALPTLAQTGLPLLVHAELAGPIDASIATLAEADWRKYSTYLRSRPDEAELQAIHLLLDLCRKYRFRLHIVHLSTALALPALRAAKAEGLPLTVETCPHYLFFAAERIPDGSTLHKCAPPIRSDANCELLWQALADGTIDLIATDHSPCPPSMKKLDRADGPDHDPDQGHFGRAWGGIASLSVALAAVWTEASQRNHTLADLTRWLSTAPAHLAGLQHQAGSLAPGREATFTIFNPEAIWTPTPKDLHFRHPISPYLGHPLKGRVTQTYLRGRPIFTTGTFPTEPFGRNLT